MDKKNKVCGTAGFSPSHSSFDRKTIVPGFIAARLVSPSASGFVAGLVSLFAMILPAIGFAASSGPHPAYRSMVSAIAEYEAIERAGGWHAILPGDDLSLGSVDPQVIDIRERLTVTYDYRGPMEANPELFEPALDEAVRRFQRRHGLSENGVVTKGVRKAMNVPVETRLRQLMAAQREWANLPIDLGGRFVWANVPGATLEAFANDELQLSMRTVVGRAQRQTPEMQAQIRRVVLNPYWHVPYRIAVQDLLPRQQIDPNFFRHRRIRVFASWQSGAPELSLADVPWSELGRGRSFPYKLRQDPGPRNSLGRVKIAFDNDKSIYLHGTPNRNLFDMPVRAYSSGCVRLEDPMSLTRWLLSENSESDQERVAGDRPRGRKTINLVEPIPLYLVYLSAWEGMDHQVHFRSDIYNRAKNILRSDEIITAQSVDQSAD